MNCRFYLSVSNWKEQNVLHTMCRNITDRNNACARMDHSGYWVTHTMLRALFSGWMFATDKYQVILHQVMDASLDDYSH